ncbi:MAG: hypothetical protein R3304_07225 [Longimicrobiales bacterium]|nr:hypothetical protein [Longimicrobiales bacterium]
MEVLALGAVGGALALSAWLKERRRARRRNLRGACAACGSAWSEVGPEDPYLIHGRLVCDGCAARARRRMPWQFGALTGAAVFASGMIAVGEGLVAEILFPAVTTLAMTLAVVHRMKSANRKAARRIATGEFPDIDGLRATRGAALPAARLVD